MSTTVSLFSKYVTIGLYRNIWALFFLVTFGFPTATNARAIPERITVLDRSDFDFGEIRQFLSLKPGLVLAAHQDGLFLYDGWNWENLLPHYFSVHQIVRKEERFYFRNEERFGYLEIQDLWFGEPVYLNEQLSDLFEDSIRIYDMQTSHSSIILSTNRGLVSVDEENEFQKIALNCILQNNGKENTIFKYSNELYVLCENNVTYRLSSEGDRISANRYVLFQAAPEYITRVLPLTGNELVITTGSHTLLFQNGRFLELPVPFESQHIFDVVKTDQSLIFSAREGLFAFNSDFQQLWHIPAGSDGGYAPWFTLYADTSQNLWIAGPENIQTIALRSPLRKIFDSHESVTAIDETDTDYVFARSSGLVLLSKERHEIVEIPIPSAIHSLATSGNTIAIATQMGIFLWDNDTLIRLNSTQAEAIVFPENSDALLLFVGNEWQEWSSGSRGEWSKTHSGTHINAEIAQLFSHGRFLYGITRNHKFFMFQYDAQSGLLPISVIDELEDKQQSLLHTWAAHDTVRVASDRAIYFLNEGQLLRDKASTNVLHEAMLHSNENNASGTFWIQKKESLPAYFPAAITEDFLPQLITGRHSLRNPSSGLFATYLSRDGALWYSMHGNVYRTDPAAGEIPGLQKPVLLSVSTLNSNKKLYSIFSDVEMITLPRVRTEFVVRMLSTDQKTPGSTQYQIRWKNSESDWSLWSAQNNVIIRPETHGKQELYIRARHQDGRISEPASYAVYIPIPWFRSFPFFAFLAVIFVLLITGIRGARKNWLRRWDGKLEERVAEVTKSYREENQELQKRSEELQFINKQRTQFFNNISHEFRTPLTLIMAPLQRLLDEKNLNEDDQEAIEVAFRNAQRLRSLTNQMLDITRVKKGIVDFSPTMGNIKLDILMVARRFVFRARQEEKEFGYRLPLDELLGKYEREKVDVIITNLISNAFKYTKSGDKIFLTAGYTKNKDGASFLKVRVEDTGIGIPEDQLDFVFDYYFQVEMDEMSYAEGTGMGLAYVKDLVEMHGGSVHVDSRIGVYTGFDILLPALDYKEEADFSKMLRQKISYFDDEYPVLSKNRIIAAKDAPFGTLLIVEDNPDLQKYLSVIFEDKFQVNLAGNGKQALSELEKYRPSLIICDVMMPEMDGWTFLDILKKNEELRTIPVVMLTALTEVEDRIKALRIGVDDYISKPFDKNELVVRVDNLLTNLKERKKYQDLQNQEPDVEEEHISELYQKIVSVIDEYATDPEFSSHLLARKLAMSERSMYAKVKAETGLTPVQLINQRRVQMSRKMLVEEREKPIGEVAFLCGFGSSNYFSRIFRKVTGITPLEYRNSRK